MIKKSTTNSNFHQFRFQHSQPCRTLRLWLHLIHLRQSISATFPKQWQWSLWHFPRSLKDTILSIQIEKGYSLGLTLVSPIKCERNRIVLFRFQIISVGKALWIVMNCQVVEVFLFRSIFLKILRILNVL